MTKDELEKYAAENRARLSKQKIALGDLVMILVGDFAGEKGVVKGITAIGNDFTDPYYEVDMACEVPDKYKCRKTIVGNENVVGGFSAREFEVIGSRCPEPTANVEGIKVGDRVKTADGMGTAKIVSGDGDYVVSRLDDGGWDISMNVSLPEKEEQQPAEEETEKPRFKVGDKVVVTSDNDYFVPYVGEIVYLNEDSADITVGRGRINVPIDRLTPHTEPTDEEGEEKLQSRLDNADSASSILNILRGENESTPAWQPYRMELAAKIAVAYAEKGRYEPSEIGAKAVEVANGVINGLKNNKK